MAKAQEILEMSLLLDDDFGIILAAEALKSKPKSKPPIFSLENYEDVRCKVDFRFHKSDIFRLAKALKIPSIMRSNGLVFKGTEGLCILLRRLGYPNRLIDLTIIFGRCKQDISNIFNAILDFIYDRFGFLLTSLDQWWLQPRVLEEYAAAIEVKGCPLPGCFGFIDGTIHRTCRPLKNQKEVYSGHKRVHGLKYQSTVVPSGLIANLYGPEPGRRHDSYMLNKSQLLARLEQHLGNPNLYLYGDSGYPLKRHLITPYVGNNLSIDKQCFNSTMSKLRICVEWEFGELYEQFSFLRYKYNQKIYLQPVAKYYAVAAILKNCQTCLYGSKTSLYFNVAPPSLEGYLCNEER